MRLQIHWGLLAILCVGCGVCRPTWATDIYVDNVAGDDHNDGSTARGQGEHVGPVRSITVGLRRAQRRSCHCQQHGHGLSRKHHVTGRAAEWLRQPAIRIGGQWSGIGRDGTGTDRRMATFSGQRVSLSAAEDELSVVVPTGQAARAQKVGTLADIDDWRRWSGVCMQDTSISAWSRGNCHRLTNCHTAGCKSESRCTRFATC